MAEPRILCLALALTACVVPSSKGSAPTENVLAHSGRPIIEVGDLENASYRIDIPASWNGELVLFCHGYDRAVRFDATAPNSMAQTFTAAGFAVAQSGYSTLGYAVPEALRETEALRRHFATKYGAPRATWITGESLGGSITMMLMEMYPSTYDGGLPMCAPLGPSLAFIKTMVFDLLVLFEYAFPNQLPSPAHVPPDYEMNLQRPEELARLLDARPEVAAALRQRTTAATNKELGLILDLFTFIAGELQRRWGGNAFDNRDTIYTGFDDDEALNDGVKRYPADSGARALAIKYYTPTGLIARPMLSLRTIYDPLISAFGSDRYPEIVQLAGRSQWFVQQYVKGRGHCEITAEERRAALAELRRWKQTGQRPTPGALRVDESGESRAVPR